MRWNSKFWTILTFSTLQHDGFWLNTIFETKVFKSDLVYIVFIKWTFDILNCHLNFNAESCVREQTLTTNFFLAQWIFTNSDAYGAIHKRRRNIFGCFWYPLPLLWMTPMVVLNTNCSEILLVNIETAENYIDICSTFCISNLMKKSVFPNLTLFQFW